MMRIGQVLLRGVAAMVELANDTAVKPRCDQQRARVAQRLALALARCCCRGRPRGVLASPMAHHLFQLRLPRHLPAASPL